MARDCRELLNEDISSLNLETAILDEVIAKQEECNRTIVQVQIIFIIKHSLLSMNKSTSFCRPDKFEKYNPFYRNIDYVTVEINSFLSYTLIFVQIMLYLLCKIEDMLNTTKTRMTSLGDKLMKIKVNSESATIVSCGEVKMNADKQFAENLNNKGRFRTLRPFQYLQNLLFSTGKRKYTNEIL